jgi:hypothetical protein
MYCTIQDIRDEGFEVCDASDARITNAILDAQDLIELHTGRFFEPRTLSVQPSWKGSPDLLLEMPIIELTSVRSIYTDDTLGDAFDATSYKAWNRHVREGMVDPDDREDPKVSMLFVRPTLVGTITDTPINESLAHRVQNLQLDGVFGYTNPVFTGGRSIASDGADAITAPDTIKMVSGSFSAANGDLGRPITVAGAGDPANNGTFTIVEIVSTDTVKVREQTLVTEGTGFTAAMATFPQWGVTPRQIRKACMLIAIKGLAPRNDSDPVDSALAGGRVRRMKVRDQEIEFTADARIERGAAITGDPEVDTLLATFRRPPKIGAA